MKCIIISLLEFLFSGYSDGSASDDPRLLECKWWNSGQSQGILSLRQHSSRNFYKGGITLYILN